jgi:hypothetical protein
MKIIEIHACSDNSPVVGKYRPMFEAASGDVTLG